MTLAILLLGLIVATCVIAYLADNLGKNLGKKRISIAGLRPRQTATLISMAASVCIMLLTVAILLATSGSLSNALLRYDEEKRLANRERERAETLAKALQTEIHSKENAIAEYDRRLAKSQNILRSTSTQLHLTQTQLMSARKQRAGAERERQAALQSVATARQNARDILARFQRARREYELLRRRLTAESTRVRQAEFQLREKQRSVNEAKAQLDRLRNQFGSTQDQLTSAQAQLEQAQAAYDQVQSNFVTQQQKLNETLAENQAALNELETRLAEIKRLTNFAARLTDVADRFAVGAIAISQGTVFAESIVPANSSSSQNRAYLERIMEQARRALSQNQSTPRLFPLPFSVGSRVVELKGEEIITHLSEYLSTFDVPASVRLTAVRNHVVGETEIDTQFLVVPVRTAYDEGEVLAETSLSSGVSDARIFNQLLALLNEAEKAARAKNVVPLLTEENPYFFATGTNERIFEALRRIQSIEGKAHVRVVAAQELSTAEPVRVRFEVERA